MIKAVFLDLSFTLIAGGSNELRGAKSAGMSTVFSEMLETKNAEQKEAISKYADYHIRHINELLNLWEDKL